MCAPAHVSGNASQINAALLFLVGPYLFTKIYKTSCLLTLAIKNLQLEVSCAFTDGARFTDGANMNHEWCPQDPQPTRIGISAELMLTKSKKTTLV